jgi:hypothetical protein
MARAGILQKVVRFVHNDPMRKAGPVPHFVQRGQDRPDVLDLLVLRPMGQIDDHAAIRIPERAQEISWRRGRVVATKNRHTR